jgi:hypothetical protein
MESLWEYLLAVGDHFFFWFGGIVLVILELIKRIPSWKENAERFPVWMFWTVASTCIFIATFQAWHEDHSRLLSQTAYLQGNVRFFYPLPNLMPMDMPLRFYIFVNNRGVAPALTPFPNAKTYLLDSKAVESGGLPIQEQLITEWKKIFEERRRNTQTKEAAPVFPNSPQSMVAEGPVFTNAERDAVFVNKTKTIFVIGAVRFTDGAGKHEAHICQYLAALDLLANSANWNECLDYDTQVDVK